MTAPDVRTAARTYARAQGEKFPDPGMTELEIETFAAGAVWGAALVTPTREQIAEVIAHSMPGWNDDTEDGALTGHWERVNAECLRQGRIYADVVLTLLQYM